MDEKAREREFYRYYQPFSRSFDPELSRYTADSEQAGNATPYCSSDLALAAFAQLGALRLNARRAIISFFDRNHQIVLAEATRTSSLQTNEPSDPADKLWRGAGVFARGNSVCEHTTELPVIMDEKLLHNTTTNVVIIPDSSKTADYCGKPFVSGHPRARFHAGVPITSPNGYHIGAYCLLDDEPREGVTPAEIEFLRDMSRTVMAHSEMVRIQAEHKRSQAMIRGFGSFIEGNSSLNDWWSSLSNRKHDRKNSLVTREVLQNIAPEKYERPSGGTIGQNAPEQSNTATNDGSRPQTLRSSSKEHSSTASSRNDSSASKEDSQLEQTPSETEDEREDDLSSHIRGAFSRAVRIIREAIDVDGAVFSDASVTSYGGLVARPSRDEDAAGSGTQKEQAVHTVIGHGEDIKEQGYKTPNSESESDSASERNCPILGCCSTESGSIFGNTESSAPELPISESSMQSSSQTYPNGAVFNFDDDVPLDAVADCVAGKQHKPKHNDHSSHKGVRAQHEQELRKVFPGVRSLILVGLWDSHRERWFAGSLLWSFSPIRIFTSDNELSYLAAFGDSIMAEVARSDARLADKAKANFISTISHELRSPLHGILGSVECFQDTVVDAFQENSIHTVETCGKTLLDTIDHLLDFAKINNFMKRSSGKGRVSRGRRDLSLAAPSSEKHELRQGMMSLDGDVDLSVISEEVVETVFAGYDYLYTSTEHPQAHAAGVGSSKIFVENAMDPQTKGPNVRHLSKDDGVTLILDFEKAVDSHWVFQTQAGAWRRIILNLIGNSSKYTREGFIKVKLGAVPLPTRSKGGISKVTSTVTDSGKGISSDFLRDRLFTPFSQEDPHTPGTGLGLSIIQQIVAGMGGNIEVQSTPNGGTEVSVTMHMVHAPLAQESVEQSIITSTAERMHGSRSNFFDSQAPQSQPNPDIRAPENARYFFMQSFRTMCRDWLEIDAEIVSTSTSKDADIFVTTERGAGMIEIQEDPAHLEPIEGKEKLSLVICDAASSAHWLRNHATAGHALDIAEYIAQPLGPRKSAKALVASFNRMNNAQTPNDMGARSRAHSPAPTPKEAFPTSAANPTERPGLASASADPPLTHPKTDTLDLPPRDVPADFQSNIKAESSQHATESLKPGPELYKDPSHSTQHPTASSDHGKMARSPTATVTPKPTLSVLLVDDNRINLQLLVTYMKKNNHSYVCAMNGLEALESYKKAFEAAKTRDGMHANVLPNVAGAAANPRAFDFVSMDISMPVMDGLESTRRIRQYEREKGVRASNIIALTGSASEQAQLEAFSSGVDLFVTKPVRSKESTEILGGTGMAKGGSPTV